MCVFFLRGFLFVFGLYMCCVACMNVALEFAVKFAMAPLFLTMYDACQRFCCNVCGALQSMMNVKDLSVKHAVALVYISRRN